MTKMRNLKASSGIMGRFSKAAKYILIIEIILSTDFSLMFFASSYEWFMIYWDL